MTWQMAKVNSPIKAPMSIKEISKMTKLMAKESMSMLMVLLTMVIGETTSNTDSDLNAGLMAHPMRVNTLRAEDMAREPSSGKIVREPTLATSIQTRSRATVR